MFSKGERKSPWSKARKCCRFFMAHTILPPDWQFRVLCDAQELVVGGLYYFVVPVHNFTCQSSLSDDLFHLPILAWQHIYSSLAGFIWTLNFIVAILTYTTLTLVRTKINKISSALREISAPNKPSIWPTTRWCCACHLVCTVVTINLYLFQQYRPPTTHQK